MFGLYTLRFEINQDIDVLVMKLANLNLVNSFHFHEVLLTTAGICICIFFFDQMITFLLEFNTF